MDEARREKRGEGKVRQEQEKGRKINERRKCEIDGREEREAGENAGMRKDQGRRLRETNAG